MRTRRNRELIGTQRALEDAVVRMCPSSQNTLPQNLVKLMAVCTGAERPREVYNRGLNGVEGRGLEASTRLTGHNILPPNLLMFVRLVINASHAAASIRGAKFQEF